MASGDLIFDDPFTEASTDTELNAHTPTVGTGWTRIHQTGSETIKARAATDDARPTAATLSRGAVYTADGTYPVADYHVLSDFTGITTSSGDEQFLLMRYAAQASNGYYRASIVNSTSTAVLVTKGASASTETTLLSKEYDITPFTNGVVVLFEAVGSDIAVFAGEVCYELYVSNADVTAAGKGGLGMGAFWADTSGDTNTNMINDNFKCVQLGANNTGWLSPTTTGEISNDFTNPSNAYSSNDVRATRVISALNTWYRQDYGDFGINTGGADATGIQVYVEWNSDDATGPEPQLQIEVSKNNGSSWSTPITAIAYSPLVTTDVPFIFGHARSLFGTTFTSSELGDANFRVRISVRDAASSGDTFALDHIKVRVFYDDAGEAETITPDKWIGRYPAFINVMPKVVSY